MQTVINSHNPDLAKAIGRPAAIFISKLDWMLNSSKMGIERDGEKWVFNTYKKWWELYFPDYHIDIIKRIVRKLKKLGVIIVKRLNAKRRHGPFKEWGDQINFYRINYDRLTLLISGKLNPKTGELFSTRNEAPEVQNAPLVGPETPEKQPAKPINTPEVHFAPIPFQREHLQRDKIDIGGNTRTHARDMADKTDQHTDQTDISTLPQGEDEPTPPQIDHEPAPMSEEPGPDEPEPNPSPAGDQPETDCNQTASSSLAANPEPDHDDGGPGVLMMLGNGEEERLQDLEDSGRIGMLGHAEWRLVLLARYKLGQVIGTPIVRRYCPPRLLAKAEQAVRNRKNQY